MLTSVPNYLELSIAANPTPNSPVNDERTTAESIASRFLESRDDRPVWNRTTYIALLALITLWAAKVWSTWAAWGNLTIDSGHEMYIPLLITQGKVLYRDVWYPYGPAAPYFNGYLFRLFGVHLSVLYWAGSLSALGSAILLYLTGMRLSAWYLGWTAGAVLLLEAFQPSLFCFPLPYAFATVYGCLLGCIFLWIAVRASSAKSSWWIFAAGTVAAAALLFKPEYGTACYGTVAVLIAVRGYLERSWGRFARDVLATLPGIVWCALVIRWMVSIGGVEFITQENLVGWPTSYFMKAYGKAWLAHTGFTVSVSDFANALLRTVPLACVLLLCWSFLWWKRSGRIAWLVKIMIALVLILYFAKTNYFMVPAWQTVEMMLTSVFFPQDMVLYIVAAAIIVWTYFGMHRSEDAAAGSVKLGLVLAYSSLLAFRILMNTNTNGYPIFYNGTVVVGFLVLICIMVPRSGRSRRFVLAGELIVCAGCLVAVAIPTARSEAYARDFVPLTTERGTIRVSQGMAENYRAAIQFMKEKAAAGETVLSVPEDTSLFFLSETYCPTRVFSFTPGIIAPGLMTGKVIREIDQKHVRYLLWSNRVFPEFGTPVFGKDFQREIGDYFKANYHRIGPLLPLNGDYWDWNAVIWERNE